MHSYHVEQLLEYTLILKDEIGFQPYRRNKQNSWLRAASHGTRQGATDTYSGCHQICFHLLHHIFQGLHVFCLLHTQSLQLLLQGTIPIVINDTPMSNIHSRCGSFIAHTQGSQLVVCVLQHVTITLMKCCHSDVHQLATCTHN